MAPLAAFLIALSSVRTRRSAANLAMFGAVVSLLASLLVGWGLAKTTTPFLATYSYISLPVAFTGPTNFQNFAIDIVLRVDHVGVAALIVVELCVIGVLGWHQVMGRAEPGAARFNALMSVLLFGATGVLVSWDLAELLAFWGLAGAATYLLLAHRWGMDEAALRARVALALPFVTDLSLLCGVAWLYSRYGENNLSTLLPILHTNPGWTVRSLVVASILLFVGAAGRLALWPLHSWVTRTAVTAPPAASAVAQSVWSVLAIVVLYRLMPIAVASNAQTVKGLLYGCGAAAIAAPLLALVGNEPRRIIALLGSGATAIGAAVVVHGFQVQYSTFAIAGVACVFAVALARAGGVLAMSAIAAAKRTDDLTEMGDAWNRMRVSALAVLVAAIVLGLSTVGALAFGVSSRSYLGIAMGEAVLLIGLGGARVFLGVSIGPLRRRRAFEPDRVREAPSSSLSWPFWLAGGGALLVVASFIHGWLDFLDGQKHPSPTAGSYALWVVVVLIGFALPVLAYVRDQDGALHVSAFAGVWLRRLTYTTSSSFERFIVAPVAEIVVRFGERWIPVGDGEVGVALDTTGRLMASGARLPVLPLVVLLAVILTVVVGLVAPGVFR
ncbi:MAG TPA: proton-conducting transporter membrane subunit [Candidatus Acidoferrum sp.]|nr:proton-conducting transporter membrane subunit [Candidatus Acidoferrum sp.]